MFTYLCYLVIICLLKTCTSHLQHTKQNFKNFETTPIRKIYILKNTETLHTFIFNFHYKFLSGNLVYRIHKIEPYYEGISKKM